MNIKDVFNRLKHDDFSLLSEKIYSEENLKKLSNLVNLSRFTNNYKLVKNLIVNIPLYNRNYDWNVGSILQHLDIDLIIDSLKRIDTHNLYNSIGLAWVLGEFKNTNRFITDFLYSVVHNSTNSDAWWRAAFSLEKLGVVEAVNLLKMSLKHERINDLEFYLNNLHDKKSIISILILGNIDNIEKIIFPKVKRKFLTSNDCSIIINCSWLIGRLKLIDNEIYQKLISLIKHENYELKYYTFFALQNNATEKLRPIMEEALNEGDPLIRKMAARGLLSIGNEKSLSILEQTLYKEREISVTSEVSKAIYSLKNPVDRGKFLIEIKSCKSENGMIVDESDKWYNDPTIYHIFSEAEDPENLCFNLVLQKIKGKRIINPLDLAMGTGRIMWQIIENVKFGGILYGTDASKNMCEFTSKSIKREGKYTSNIKIIHSTIKDLPKNLSLKSNFIISSFGFPSKISNQKLCLEELKAVHSLLSEDGVFFTIGWDESFNDELNRMWFKYIPDDIHAKDFEEWRDKRVKALKSPRNCHLHWFKRGIQVPLQFTSLKESANVMGYLFGRDAAQYVINNGKTEWMMRMGITFNTKQELSKIIARYARS